MSDRVTKQKLTQLKMEAAHELGRLQYVKENNDHYKGDLPSRTNGEQGGPIGGRMVKKMIASMESDITGQS